MIMTCKQVAKALAENRYYEMPWHRRITMFIHIRICAVCGRYHQQVIDMQKGVHDYLKHEDAGDITPTLKLSDEARRRIAERLHSIK